MLEFMRKNANSWLMVFLFAVIIFVFALNFGPWAGENVGGNDSYAAIVNSENISLQEFRIAFQSQYARMRQFRPDYNEEQAEQDGLKERVLNQLIVTKLLEQEGKKHGLNIGPRTLAEGIKERVFSEDEEFNKDEYKRRINGYFGANVSQFENQVAKEMLASQFASVISGFSFVSDIEAKEEFINKNTKASIGFIKIDPKFFASEANKPTLDEIESFLAEKMKSIEDFYNENIGDYIKEKQVKARHILIKAEKTLPETEKKSLNKKALDILEKVKAGEDFADMAKQYSEDDTNKNKGGDLGYFPYGAMVENFSKAAFSLNIGEISEVVESPFGFHIIKVEAIKEEEKTSLDEAKKDIAATLLTNEKQSEYAKNIANNYLSIMAKTGDLINLVLPNAVNKIKDAKATVKNNQPIIDKTTDFNLSSYYVPKIGRNQKIIDETFKLSLDNPIGKEVIEHEGVFYAIKLLTKTDADLTKFEDEKENIKTRIQYPRSRALLEDMIKHLKEQASIKINTNIVSALLD